MRLADVQIHLGVVVPRVAAFLARGPELEFVALQLCRARVVMCRGEQDASVWTEEGASRLSQARRDSLGVAGGECHRIDLIEGVPRLTLALEDQAAAVVRPV